AEPGEGLRARVEHVAQDLGRHDDDGRLGVDRGVAREEPDLGLSVAPHEVGVLLVRQCLDRCGVEGLAVRSQREVHRELPDDRLARSRGRRDQDAAALLERAARGDLELVEREVEQCSQFSQRGAVRGRVRVVVVGGARLARYVHVRPYASTRRMPGWPVAWNGSAPTGSPSASTSGGRAPSRVTGSMSTRVDSKTWHAGWPRWRPALTRGSTLRISRRGSPEATSTWTVPESRREIGRASCRERV